MCFVNQLSWLYLVKVKWKIYVQSDVQTNWIRFPPLYAKNVIWCKTFVFSTRSGIRFSLFSFVFHGIVATHEKKCKNNTFNSQQNAIWIIWCFMLLLSAASLFASKHRSPESSNSHSILNFNYKLQDWYYHWYIRPQTAAKCGKLKI